MTLDYESLPQRPSRAKRARLVVDGGEAGNAAGTDAAAAGGARAPGAPPPLPDAAGFELASRPDTDGLDRSGGEAGKGGKGGRDAGTSDDGDGSDRSCSSSSESDGDDDGNAPPRLGKPAVRGRAFEYLDHTADIQIHSWGPTLEVAMAEAGLGLFHYMTPITGLMMTGERAYTATGHDLHSLLFSFLDELLFGFATESFACAALAVTCLVRGGGEAKTPWTLTAVGKGEAFDRERHAAGTEVKAITYSAMRVDEEEGRAAEVWVIVDI